MAKYMLSLPVEEIAVGSSYKKLPLQCTIFPYFTLPDQARGLANALVSVTARHQPIRLTPASRAMFGRNLDVPVTKLRRDRPLMKLHQDLHTWVIAAGANIQDEDWVGAGYQPHVSDHAGRSFTKGVVVSQIILLRISPDSKYAVAGFTLS